MKNKSFVIGVDGGGTKTVAALADFRGRILKKIKIGSTNPNKIGFKRAIFNLKRLLSEISKGYQKKIKIAYLGLAGGLERDKKRKEKIKRELQKHFPFKIEVEGDQKIAFRAGTDEKNGIVVIAGTGSIAMGWKEKRKAISGGWDWLIGDQGSAFWVGKKFLEKLTKAIDGREKMKRALIFLKKIGFKKESDFYQKIYKENFVEKIAAISKIVDEIAKKKDKSSKYILIEAAEELAKMVKSVIEQLKFKKERIPIVLVGGMFKSKIFREKFQKEVKKINSKANFIFLKKKPVLGAIKIALEKIFPK